MTHNTFDTVRQATTGHFSILDTSHEGGLHYTEPVSVYAHAQLEHNSGWAWNRMIHYLGGSPYSGLTLQVSSPSERNGRNRDVVYFAESARQGYGRQGAMHRVEVDLESGRVDADILKMTEGYSVSTPPVVTRDGTWLFLTSMNSTVFGWIGEKEKKVWKAQLDESHRNRTASEWSVDIFVLYMILVWLDAYLTIVGFGILIAVDSSNQ